MQKYYLTHEGLDKFKIELEQLIKRRPEIADAIARARELGDLRENSEYQTAKDEQTMLENRIIEIKDIVKHAQLIGKSHSDSVNVISLGAKIQLEATQNSTSRAFEIVGSMEADPFAGRISDDSVIGRSLLNKAVGDEVALPNQEGVATVYKIKVINY